MMPPTRETYRIVIPRWSGEAAECGGPIDTKASQVFMGGPDKPGHDEIYM